MEIAWGELAKQDFEAAKAEFAKALLTQRSAKIYYDRAVARAALGEEALTQADLLETLKLDPKHAYAAFALGRYALRRGDLAEAASRFAAAQTDSAKPAKMAEMIASAYERAGDHLLAYPYFDRVVTAAAEAPTRARALNAACWSRAEAGSDLKPALEDCDASLSLTPDAANTLDSRGLVELRIKSFEKAKADIDLARTTNPDIGSMFAR